MARYVRLATCLPTAVLIVLEQKDILVNPKSKFYLRRGNGEGIELGYPEAEFFRLPTLQVYTLDLRSCWKTLR